MNKTQRRQMARGKAFNQILRMFHPKSNWTASEFPRDESSREKRDSEVQYIMEQYLKEIQKIRQE